MAYGVAHWADNPIVDAVSRNVMPTIFGVGWMMSFHKKRSKNLCRFQFEGSVDISQAAGLKKEIVACFGRGDEIRFSFEKTAQLDVTAVQLLWAVSIEAQHRQLHASLEGEVPRAILLALSAAGFEQFPLSRAGQ